MKTSLPAFLLLSMLAAACQKAVPSGNETAAAPTKTEVAAKPAPAPAPKVAAASDCAPEPKLALARDFADPRKAFAPDAPAFREMQAHFDAAYRKACASGVLRGHPLMDPKAAQPDTLFLKNAPDANDAAFYRDGEENGPAADRVMVLEYFFLTADGATHVPSVDDINEAIFCSAQGASEQEQEESGRCLVD